MTKPLLYIRTGYALYIGPLSDNREHRHHMLQVAGAGGSKISFVVEGTEHDGPGAIVEAGVSHRFDSRGRAMWVLLLDTEGPLAPVLRHRLAGETCKVLTESPDFSIPERISDGEGSLPSGEEMDRLVKDLFAEEDRSPREKNPQMEKLLDYLKSAEGKRCSAADAAAYIGLSESRMLHRFTGYTGVPFRRYLLWLRLRDAIDSITGGMNFTDAAHEAGFSDSAHLSRTFVETFGMTLLKIFKNPDPGRFIQVIT